LIVLKISHQQNIVGFQVDDLRLLGLKLLQHLGQISRRHALDGDHECAQVASCDLEIGMDLLNRFRGVFLAIVDGNNVIDIS